MGNRLRRLGLSAFAVRGLQFLGEGVPDSLVAAFLLPCPFPHEGLDARALVVVGTGLVLAGADEVDDLPAGLEFGLSGSVEAPHKGHRPGLFGTSLDGVHDLLQGREGEGADRDFVLALEPLELLADVRHRGGQGDSDDGEVRLGESGKDAHGRIRPGEQAEEGLLAAHDAVDDLVVGAEARDDRAVGAHHAFAGQLEGLSRGDEVLDGFAFGDCGDERDTGFVEAEDARGGEAFAQAVCGVLCEVGDFVAAGDEITSGGFDAAD